MLTYTPTPEEQIREFDEKGYLIVRNVRMLAYNG